MLLRRSCANEAAGLALSQYLRFAGEAAGLLRGERRGTGPRQVHCLPSYCRAVRRPSSGADLLFTSSAVEQSQRRLTTYVNTPSQGRESRPRIVQNHRRFGSWRRAGDRARIGGLRRLFQQYIELVSADDEPPNSAIHRVALEEPVATQAHTGVGNLRGWAVATEGITKVTILIDGVYAFDAPYGGSRGDVGGAFPDVPNATDSGFSLAFNYSSLQAGAHTITAVAHTPAGATKESSADFQVVRFDSQFITGDDAVNLSNATCLLEADQISIVDAAVDGAILDLLLKWRTAEQGFEIVEIR